LVECVMGDIYIISIRLIFSLKRSFRTKKRVNFNKR